MAKKEKDKKGKSRRPKTTSLKTLAAVNSILVGARMLNIVEQISYVFNPKQYHVHQGQTVVGWLENPAKAYKELQMRIKSDGWKTKEAATQYAMYWLASKAAGPLGLKTDINKVLKLVKLRM